MSQKRTDTQNSYDRIADEYVRRIYHELDGKPFDRAFLDRFAEWLRGRGVVCDMGCGPGHVARYLADRGLDMIGVDLSPGMVRQAAALNPDIPFGVGDMLRLAVADGAWAGIAAFYSIIHISPDEVVAALTEMRRVLLPGGLLALAFHLGDGAAVRVEEMWAQQVALDFWFYGAAEMVGYLEQAGFLVEEVGEREPYPPDVEHQSRRAYLLARKAGRMATD
ncbi:Methylase involved in ubiquinone/menaquinone biosynthesis (fragment) [Candidatus Promineifilum breve]|uniref:Methylase involved in ubiquinone/menaquinone biosynthesis n=1 Tax=Candidatus Promineifilum breve TaxID=1806508 RepID=A0A160T5W9_9CHLR